MIYVRMIKPILDRLLAFLIIFGFFPVWLLGYLIVFLSQGRRVFFRQLRTGKRMKRFVLYKIRTLMDSSESDLSLTGRNYTFFGKGLRIFGIDELPQLVNVLKGEMSFIGPRPLPIEYEDRYNDAEKRRFGVLPGITGWAQVNGRNDTSWAERFAFDIWYVDHISFLVDCEIVWHTFRQLAGGNMEETKMSVFQGSSSL